MNELHQLRDLLDELDVEPVALRRDPRGASWLCEEGRALCERDSGCRAELNRFVQGERELFAEADVGEDPFFTARVLGGLPAPLRFTGISPGQRVLLLAGFHLAAGLVAFAVLAWLTPDLVDALARQTHQWLELSPDGPGAASWGWWSSVALAVVAIVAFAATRSHTSVA